MQTFLIAVVTGIILFAIVRYLKKRTYTKLLNYLKIEDFDGFYQNVDRFNVRLLFNRFNITYMKLNASLLEQNKKRINETFEEIEPMLIKESLKNDVYMKAFNYYVSVEDKNMSKKYLDKINELSNAQMKLEANRVYNIYIKKDDTDLASLLEEIEDLPEAQKGVNEFLVSLIYKNKKDKVNQKKYEDLAKQHMSLLDEQIAEKMKAEGKL